MEFYENAFQARFCHTPGCFDRAVCRQLCVPTDGSGKIDQPVGVRCSDSDERPDARTGIYSPVFH